MEIETVELTIDLRNFITSNLDTGGEFTAILILRVDLSKTLVTFDGKL